MQKSCRRMLDVFKEKLVVGDVWLEPNENRITCPDLFSEGVLAVELLSARMRVRIRASATTSRTSVLVAARGWKVRDQH